MENKIKYNLFYICVQTIENILCISDVLTTAERLSLVFMLIQRIYPLVPAGSQNLISWVEAELVECAGVLGVLVASWLQIELPVASIHRRPHLARG